MKVATYRARGLFGGRIVIHRQIEGNQRWRIKIRTRRETGEIDTHELKPAQKLPIGALSELVQRSIAEVCAPGARLVDAWMEFHVDVGGT